MANAFGDQHEACRAAWPLDDLDPPAPRLARRLLHPFSLIPGVGEDHLDEWKAPPHPLGQHLGGTVAILDIGRVYHHAQQQPEVVGEDMALDPLDLLARVIADRIDRRPPF